VKGTVINMPHHDPFGLKDLNQPKENPDQGMKALNSTIEGSTRGIMLIGGLQMLGGLLKK
jgi:hypothetical protein